MYSTDDLSCLFIGTQTYMLIGDIVLLLHFAGIDIPIPAEFIRLLDYNSLFLISMILLFYVLTEILFYLYIWQKPKTYKNVIACQKEVWQKV